MGGMRTFGELLTEQMRRAGVSDAEMARTLGVQRQTIFRWREGLTQHPRERQDVLRMASKLRLTAVERDELLLAAGFPPEAAPELHPTDQSVVSSSQTTGSHTLTESARSSEGGAGRILNDRLSGRCRRGERKRRQRRLWLMVRGGWLRCWLF